MQYGLELPNGGSCGDPQQLAAFAERAEAAGWDGVFLEDYIIYYDADTRTYDPWMALAVMALRTTRIRLGTTVTPVARRRPWKLAREAVTLDHLSHGRVILGVGLGDSNDFVRFGEPSATSHRASKLDESLALLAGFWSGQPFAYRGTHFTIAATTLLPPPVQSPRIPIWVGGSAQKPGPIQRAAQWDGMLPMPVETPTGTRHLTAAEVQELRATIATSRTVDTPFDLAVGGMERANDWEWERAHIAAVAAAGATWWMEGIPAADHRTMQAAIDRGPLRIG